MVREKPISVKINKFISNSNNLICKFFWKFQKTKKTMNKFGHKINNYKFS